VVIPNLPFVVLPFTTIPALHFCFFSLILLNQPPSRYFFVQAGASLLYLLIILRFFCVAFSFENPFASHCLRPLRKTVYPADIDVKVFFSVHGCFLSLFEVFLFLSTEIFFICSCCTSPPTIHLFIRLVPIFPFRHAPPELLSHFVFSSFP